RQEIDKAIAADPSVRQSIEETRQLARVLTAGLAAEQAATPMESVVRISASKPSAATPVRWARYAVAAAVLLAVFGGTYLVWQIKKTDPNSSFTSVADSSKGEASGEASDFRQSLDRFDPDAKFAVESNPQPRMGDDLKSFDKQDEKKAGDKGASEPG